jgi:hypothetical protein
MLPKIFKPKGLYDLIRIGKENDGGYLVGKNSLLKSEYLISFGINDDWSFEEQFRKYNSKIKIFAYDPYVDNTFFFWKTWFSLLSLFRARPKYFYYNIKKWILFKRFFDNKKNFFFLKKIGKGGVKKPSITIKEIIKSTKNCKNIFFKIDIEGSEYRILDDLIKNFKYISGIVIEFHDVDLHLNKIVNFINKINLEIVHIHPNNCAECNLFDMPTVLEITFEKNSKLLKNSVLFPHPLDQKNDPRYDDVKLIFQDYNKKS